MVELIKLLYGVLIKVYKEVNNILIKILLIVLKLNYL